MNVQLKKYFKKLVKFLEDERLYTADQIEKLISKIRDNVTNDREEIRVEKLISEYQERYGEVDY